MYHADTWKEKVILFLKIIWPIVVTQVGLAAMNFVDTVMSGRVSKEDLAGVAIGSSLWMPVFVGINGILMAASPLIAHLIGQGKHKHISRTVSQTLYVAVGMAIVLFIAGAFFLRPILGLMELEPKVEHVAFHYLIGLSIGIIPLFATNVLRYFFDAQGFTRITMMIILLAIPFNVVLNAGFIFGYFGLPALGGIGAGYATAITYWITFLISVIITFRNRTFREHKLFIKWPRPELKAWKEILSIGVPMGLSVFFEASIFSVVTLFMGALFDTLTVSAHQIALNVTSMIFMVPLSMAMGLTILVGYSVGGGKRENARQYAILGVGGSIGFLMLCSVFLFTFREVIASAYTTDPAVIQLAGAFLMIATLYQVSDGAQASLQGVLRGYKDVNVPFWIAFVSYWIIGIPSGYILAQMTTLGPFGFWVGIIIGLTSAAIGFLIRLRTIRKRDSRFVTHSVNEPTH
ncbi:MATE family efflux transporter [Bacillaceae bacterium SIJ1]|uniref:MATE family efflux transporter n=1 Tax=Litoribacterium kuwaitense TaxID=1398745 RepID=UPI0013E9E735|nr:MATE family efflux transporter [Litoribacterium kuwaitense]NGP46121.1 MATE family efflux transporter [Litoribacterium kuwaitense]